MANTTDTYDHDATLNAAFTAYSQGEIDAARDLAELATENRPEDAEAWSILGLALIRFDADAGRAALTKATEIEANEPRWFLHLGASLMDIGDTEAAQSTFARAVELSEGHPEALQGWAGSLLSLRRYGDAAQVYGRVLQTVQTPEIWERQVTRFLGQKILLVRLKPMKTHTLWQRALAQ